MSVPLPIDQQITFLYTHDLAATARFYEEVMGLPLALDQGDCRIYRVSADAYLGFCQRESATEQPSGVILTLVTPDVDQWYRTLSDRGVAFENPRAAGALPGYIESPDRAAAHQLRDRRSHRHAVLGTDIVR